MQNAHCFAELKMSPAHAVLWMVCSCLAPPAISLSLGYSIPLAKIDSCLKALMQSILTVPQSLPSQTMTASQLETAQGTQKLPHNSLSYKME